MSSIGPSLPPQQSKRSVGPARPTADVKAASTQVASVEERARAWIERGAAEDEDSGEKRPEWMTQLPSVEHPGSVVGARSFSRRGVAGAGEDRSKWTSAPGAAAAKSKKTDSITELGSAIFESERDKKMAAAMHAINEAKPRGPSLTEDVAAKRKQEEEEEQRKEEKRLKRKEEKKRKREEKEKKKKKKKKKEKDDRKSKKKKNKSKSRKKKRSKSSDSSSASSSSSSSSSSDSEAPRKKKRAAVIGLGPGAWDRDRDIGASTTSHSAKGLASAGGAGLANLFSSGSRRFL